MPHDLPRSVMVATLAPLPAAAHAGVRVPLASDQAALGRLMHDAYVDTVDYDGEDEAQALREIERTFGGEYGPFDAACSRIATVGPEIVSAALLTRWRDKPLVAYSMTAKAHAGRGFARACLIEAMRALHERGEPELRLVVTLANARALKLYESLGFVATDHY